MDNTEKINMDPKQKQMLDDVFDAFSMLAGGNLVSLMHVDGGFTRYSPVAVDLFQLPGEYVSNGAMNWADYLHPEDRKRYLNVMTALLDGGAHTYDITYRVKIKTGGYGIFRAIGAVLRNADGKPSLVGGMTINQGLTENTDPVTVLRNKYGFFEDLNAIHQDEQKAVVLLAGISGLANINQTYGYTYGNRILQETAFLIQETIGSRGYVYRMDGPTFAVLTVDLSKEEVAAVYDAIRMKMQRGIRVDGIRTILSANGGLISIESGAPMSADTVYSCLNYAYRESKQKRNGELVDFNGSINYNIRESLEMVNTIRDCIIEGCKGFYIDYQPVVSSTSEKPVGMEALIRWRGEPYGEVEPMEFIPILEKDFVFEELSEWILKQVTRDGLEFLKKAPDLSMSVNISSAQLEDEYFIDSLTRILDESGFPAENLCIEITKGCRLLELDKLKSIVDALHSYGIRIIIDDFGTGFESVNFLKKLSADYIKFDRELVGEIERSRIDRDTMRYLSKLASIRGARVCVKGVETPGMRDILKRFDINGLQGNLYCKPEPFPVIMRDLFEK